MRSPSWQPVMAGSIPVGRTPGQQERRQRSAACTLITQCTAEHPETEGLHHVSDSLITPSGYLKDYWWGNWFPAAFLKVPQTLWLHVRLCFIKLANPCRFSILCRSYAVEFLPKQCFLGVQEELPLVQFLLVSHWWMWKPQKTTGGFQKIVITRVRCLISDICGITVGLAENSKSRLSHSASASFQSNCSELRLSGPQSSPLHPFLCLLSSLSLKSFCLLSACISVTGMSKHISCIQGGFQWHQSVPPTGLSSRWNYFVEDTDTSALP